ncbi:hypothetical protein E2320_021023, partial [Naja naja]
ILLGQEL